MTGELERRTNWSTSRFLHSEQAVPLDPDSASGLRSTRSRLIALALIYAGFIIYGSLLPFEFHALPWLCENANTFRIPVQSLRGIG